MLAVWQKHRVRISQAVLVVGLLGLFFQLAPHVPRDIELDLRLGDRHAEVVALELYLSAGEEVLRAVSLRYPKGAPRAVSHTARLPPGEIDLRAQLTLRDGRTVDLDRPFRTPEEGLAAAAGMGPSVRIDLSE